MNETPIRAYSKQELAQTYFPDIALGRPSTASARGLTVANR